MPDIYSINWLQLILMLLPPPLRLGLVVAYMEVATGPLQQLHDTFATYRADTLLRLSYNGETPKLERMLNNEYYGDYSPNATRGTTNRYIWIETVSDRVEREWLYLRVENTPLYTYLRGEARIPPDRQVYMNVPADYNEAVDFIVWCPAAWWAGLTWEQQERARALVRRYKMAGVSFSFKTY